MLFLQATDGNHVDMASKELFEVQSEPREVEQRGSFDEANEKVVVADVAVVAPRDRADESDGVGLAASSGLSDCIAVLAHNVFAAAHEFTLPVGAAPVSIRASGLMAGLLSLHRQSHLVLQSSQSAIGRLTPGAIHTPNLLTKLLTDDPLRGIIGRYGLLRRSCKTPRQMGILLLAGTGCNGPSATGGPKVRDPTLSDLTGRV